jgi:hypothetical protein
MAATQVSAALHLLAVAAARQARRLQLPIHTVEQAAQEAALLQAQGLLAQERRGKVITGDITTIFQVLLPILVAQVVAGQEQSVTTQVNIPQVVAGTVLLLQSQAPL